LFRQKPLEDPKVVVGLGKMLVLLGCHCIGNAAAAYRFQTFWYRLSGFRIHCPRRIGSRER
jgi:hypothetical protein